MIDTGIDKKRSTRNRHLTIILSRWSTPTLLSFYEYGFRDVVTDRVSFVRYFCSTLIMEVSLQDEGGV